MKKCVHGHKFPIPRPRHCTECEKNYKKLWRKNCTKNTPYYLMLYNAKSRASKANLPYNLDTEWAKTKWTGYCEITGIKFDLTQKGRANGFSPSLDRIVNSLGYTKENSRFILMSINSFKLKMSDEEMFFIASKIKKP